MWEAFEVRNNLTKTMAKKLAIVLFVMAITLVTAGCSPKPVGAIDTPTTANTPVSLEPKPAPPIETKSPRELELEALLEKAPKIDGLTKFIEDDKIIYKNSEGVKSGYYVEKAYYNGEETDGVSLSAEVIEGIVSKNREEGLEGSLAMPVDPSEGQVVKVDYFLEKVMYNTPLKGGTITISSDRLITITNSIFGKAEIEKYIFAFKGEATRQSQFVSYGLARKDNIGCFTLKALRIGFIDTGYSYSSPFIASPGEFLGRTEDNIIIRKVYKTIEDYDKYFIYESDILKIRNSLVFCMVNESP
ncbi:hypothetical protein SDC9_63114 [bioreactor metagenome]|uniref:Uncharacterized protein n=1 Tax=bioreactor metagenome TaxID=1076179 RepID=A0A644XR60_9ZZZZ